MKRKRLLSLLVLLAAVVTGAWAEGKVRISVSNVYGNETDKLGSGCLVYFLTTDMASTDSWAKQPSFEAFKNALEGKYSKGLTTNGALGNTVVNNSDLGLTDEASVTCYLLILNSSEITEGVSYYITQTTNITTSAVSMVSASFGTQATNSQNPANWHEVPAAPAGYTVSMPQDTPDAEKWTARAGTDGTYQQLPLEGVAAGTAVSVKYNGTKKVKSVKAVKKAEPLIVNPVVGQVIGDDGKNYADAAAATSAGATAVAVIAYVGSDTKDATFKNGLAIALADEGEMKWSPAKSTCEGKTAITGAKWCLPSEGQWTQMFAANGGNGGSYTGLNTTITNAGGTTLREGGYYWSSSEEGASRAWFVELHSDGSAEWWFGSKDNSDVQARACLAF